MRNREFLKAFIYSFFYNLFPRRAAIFSKPKKIIIVYSKQHFDPENDSPDRLFTFSSSANLARNINEVCSNVEVIYRDQRDPIIDTEGVDMIFGIISYSFYQYCKKYPHARKILFLVNSHPYFRNSVLRAEAKNRGVNVPREELVVPLTTFKCMNEADDLVLIGNDTVRKTFERYGAFGKNIRLINSGVNLEQFTPGHSPQTPPLRILYSSTTLGIRKGIFRLIELWNKIAETSLSQKVELVILGENKYFEKEVSEFLQSHKNIDLVGWVDSSTPGYIEVLRSCHIVLGLSHEEGQVGSVLEAMSTGAVPIVTKECGIPISNNMGLLIDKYETDTIIQTLQKLTDPKELDTQRKLTRDYIIKNHSWDTFKKELAQIIYGNN